jgi:hypothetical protein
MYMYMHDVYVYMSGFHLGGGAFTPLESLLVDSKSSPRKPQMPPHNANIFAIGSLYQHYPNMYMYVYFLACYYFDILCLCPPLNTFLNETLHVLVNAVGTCV